MSDLIEQLETLSFQKDMTTGEDNALFEGARVALESLPCLHRMGDEGSACDGLAAPPEKHSRALSSTPAGGGAGKAEDGDR